MTKQVSTNDFYEASFYLMNGCELVDIEGTQANGKILCTLIITGKDLSQLQLQYLNGDAVANIIELRRAVGQINAWVHQAKKKFKNQLHTGGGQ